MSTGLAISLIRVLDVNHAAVIMNGAQTTGRSFYHVLQELLLEQNTLPDHDP